MHERYLPPAVAFLGIFVAFTGSRVATVTYVLLSAAYLANLRVVLHADPWHIPRSALPVAVASIVVAAFGWVVVTLWRGALDGRARSVDPAPVHG